MEEINLEKLHLYQLCREFSRKAWAIYEKMDWQNKKIIGDQFIKATDSVGANIAEGYGRFHYQDRIRFYYIARGSLIESKYWMGLLKERNVITEADHSSSLQFYSNIIKCLNGFINYNYKNKNLIINH